MMRPTKIIRKIKREMVGSTNLTKKGWNGLKLWITTPKGKRKRKEEKRKEKFSLV